MMKSAASTAPISTSQTVKRLDDYVQQAKISLDREQFRQGLFAFLERQPSRPQLEPTWIDTLFEITATYLRQRAAMRALIGDDFVGDMNGTDKLLDKMERQLEKDKAMALQFIQGKLRNTQLHARSILRWVDRHLANLDQLREQQRIDRSMFAALSNSAKKTDDYVRELDLYLDAVCKLRPEDRDLVISAALIAARLIPDGKGDVVARIPMRRSRSRQQLKDVEICVDWLRQLRSGPQSPQPAKKA